MMVKNVLDLIGKTPVVELAEVNNTKSTILAKLEALNPSGSIKDVMARYMIDIAEKNGILRPGSKIIEETSGNTGISFAMIAALKGYQFVAVMPEHMSQERIQMMRAFGAEIVLTPEKEGFAGALEMLEQLGKENKDAWLPRQFSNPDNIAAHREITGQRILKEIGDRIDAFVAGVGTGGTLMGVAEALKRVYPEVRIVAVEPAESAVMIGEEPGSHIIQGIGPGFIPSLVNMDLIDEVIKVKDDDAVEMTKKLIKEEGLMVGISSGANVLAALEVARKSAKSKTIVTILPDRGERYLSMNLF
ncbi:MAG: cysteine synthase A [Dehalococcoidia bacterium]|nr:MAG: cysteine synthase A [Dehalococcoidia bacterium]